MSTRVWLAGGCPRARFWLPLSLILAIAIFPSVAQASQLIDTNASNVTLAVDSKGEALITYDKNGATKRALAWGALNALASGTDSPQVSFKLDYSGGYGKYHTDYWKTFANTCKPYSGPSIPNMVVGCDAPDGSYWALQTFPQPLPDLGFTPWTAAQKEVWLELSHWSGSPAALQVTQGWVYGNKYQYIFGKVTYLGKGIYGNGSTRYGVPTDSYGRLIYLDTLDPPAYGTGWHRENSFLPHKPNGSFCYGFYSHNPTTGGYSAPPGQTAMRGPGVGTTYQITVQGPGVTPDVSWQGPAIGAYSSSSSTDQTDAQQEQTALTALGDPTCSAHLH